MPTQLNDPVLKVVIEGRVDQDQIRRYPDNPPGL